MVSNPRKSRDKGSIRLFVMMVDCLAQIVKFYANLIAYCKMQFFSFYHFANGEEFCSNLK